LVWAISEAGSNKPAVPASDLCKKPARLIFVLNAFMAMGLSFF